MQIQQQLKVTWSIENKVYTTCSDLKQTLMSGRQQVSLSQLG